MEQREFENLLVQCRSGAPAQQVAAIHALLDHRAYEAVATIAGLLGSSDAAVRSTAAQALGYLGKQESEVAGPALLSALADPEDIVRSAAVDALGVLGYRPALAAVRDLLRNDPEPLVRAAAAETLGDLGDSQALADLELALRDADEAVRAYAAGSIGLLGSPQSLSQLQAALAAESSPSVRAELLGARYRLGAAEDLEQLLSLLETGEETPATVISNLLADLTERRMPATLATDATRLRAALMSVSQRLPILRSQAEQIIARLVKLESEIK
jgi:HEAT repeat protein